MQLEKIITLIVKKNKARKTHAYIYGMWQLYLSDNYRLHTFSLEHMIEY